MRIPHFVSKNTQDEYTPSAETLRLKYEQGRSVEPENFLWDALEVPSLVTLCVQVIAKAFKDKPILNELPCAEREHILELIPTDLPLEMVVPLIQDDIYWERRYKAEFGQLNRRQYAPLPWKESYLEKFISRKLEDAQPQYADEDAMFDLLEMVNPFIHKLNITQMQPWKPPLYYEPEEIPDVWPIQHISFVPVFRSLVNIVELDITYGLKDIWESYKPSMFKVSVNDIKHLAKGIQQLTSLSVFRLRKCAIEDDHIQHLCKGLIDNTTLLELDFSHCLIKDRGAMCIAKLLTVHPCLGVLRLTNNQIGTQGGVGLGFALMHTTCAPLQLLDLRLNPLKHEGTMGIFRATIRVNKIATLNIAGVLFNDETALRFAQMLGINRSLRKVDISSNYFTDEAAQTLVDSIHSNRMIEWIDLRECNIDEEVLAKINRLLFRNRARLDDGEDDEQIQQEEIELVEGEEGEYVKTDEDLDLD